MSWVVNFRKDADKADVGTATANFMDGGLSVFAHSRRIDGKKGAVKFVAEAKAAKLKFDTDSTKNSTIAAEIQTKLNT